MFSGDFGSLLDKLGLICCECWSGVFSKVKDFSGIGESCDFMDLVECYELNFLVPLTGKLVYKLYLAFCITFGLVINC